MKLTILGHVSGKRCDCESLQCHEEGNCPKEAFIKVELYGMNQCLCGDCYEKAKNITHIFDYFEDKLDGYPADETLQNLPIDSHCGQACKQVIDATDTLVRCWAEAFGSEDERIDQAISTTEEVIAIFWRG